MSTNDVGKHRMNIPVVPQTRVWCGSAKYKMFVRAGKTRG